MRNINKFLADERSLSNIYQKIGKKISEMASLPSKKEGKKEIFHQLSSAGATTSHSNIALRKL
jgi:hypothetical protein